MWMITGIILRTCIYIYIYFNCIIIYPIMMILVHKTLDFGDRVPQKLGIGTNKSGDDPWIIRIELWNNGNMNEHWNWYERWPTRTCLVFPLWDSYWMAMKCMLGRYASNKCIQSVSQNCFESFYQIAISPTIFGYSLQ
jgi:hypothetical protein